MGFTRLKTESAKAYEAFKLYAEMGAGRSQEAVSKELAKSRQLISRWAARHSWVERAQSYDLAQDELKRRAQGKALQKEQEKWARRQFDMADKLFDKAEQMLKFPLATTKTVDGKTEVHPARWQMKDAGTIADTAVKMARLAMGQETERTVTTVEGKRRRLANVLGVQPEQLPEPESDSVH
jgi:hypothetical protein